MEVPEKFHSLFQLLEIEDALPTPKLVKQSFKLVSRTLHPNKGSDAVQVYSIITFEDFVFPLKYCLFFK